MFATGATKTMVGSLGTTLLCKAILSQGQPELIEELSEATQPRCRLNRSTSNSMKQLKLLEETYPRCSLNHSASNILNSCSFTGNTPQMQAQSLNFNQHETAALITLQYTLYILILSYLNKQNLASSASLSLSTNEKTRILFSC